MIEDSYGADQSAREANAEPDYPSGTDTLVGFTGTRQGLTTDQDRALSTWLKDNQPAEFHHGCCMGADTQAVDAVRSYCPDTRLVAHPPVNRTLVNQSNLDVSHEKRNSLPYLDRNRQIVRACTILLACPAGPEEQRSGTWSTVRFARNRGQPVVIFWPDGTVTEEGGES